jgi:hypothetical protein
MLPRQGEGRIRRGIVKREIDNPLHSCRERRIHGVHVMLNAIWGLAARHEEECMHSGKSRAHARCIAVGSGDGTFGIGQTRRASRIAHDEALVHPPAGKAFGDSPPDLAGRTGHHNWNRWSHTRALLKDYHRR